MLKVSGHISISLICFFLFKTTGFVIEESPINNSKDILYHYVFPVNLVSMNCDLVRIKTKIMIFQSCPYIFNYEVEILHNLQKLKILSALNSAITC